MKIKSLILGSVAALGFSAGSAKAADLDAIVDFALDICDAVNAVGITISSADHCMKFSGEATWRKEWEWYNGSWDTNYGDDPPMEWAITIEVLGDSDFGVTRFWTVLKWQKDWVDACNLQSSFQCIFVDEAGISIGNTTVLSVGYNISAFNADQDTTLVHLLDHELDDQDDETTGGLVAKLTHDLGNGWSVTKSIECIARQPECAAEGDDGVAFVGVIAYDQDGITGHISVLFNSGYGGSGFEFETLHAGIQAELDNFTIQAAIVWLGDSYDWEGNASIKAALDFVELAAAIYGNSDSFWEAVFSAQFDAGDFTIKGAFLIDSDSYWKWSKEVSTALTDNLDLTVGFSFDSDSAWEGFKKVAWDPGGGYTASEKVYFGNDGNPYWGISSEVGFAF